MRLPVDPQMLADACRAMAERVARESGKPLAFVVIVAECGVPDPPLQIMSSHPDATNAMLNVARSGTEVFVRAKAIN